MKTENDFWAAVPAWEAFFLTTIVHDQHFSDKKVIKTAMLMECNDFAHVMAGTDVPIPDGTECRAWPRAYLAVKGYKEYAIELQPHREVFAFLPAMKEYIKLID